MLNKMMTPKVLNLILALQVLTTLIMYVNALPITSKPIESTAENLAWQAWLMLPPEQKNLEKSRKVTPKSIFTLPFRECPPGHHLFENRCIPTVQIDQTALLTQELLGFVDGLGGDGDNNYEEFDYDDLGGEVVAEVMYEPAQKLNGNDDSSYNDTTYDQLPSQDEPLKFNIFQQKFPTDYESIATPSEEAEQQLQQQLIGKSNNSTNVPLAEAVNALAMATQMQNATNSNVDLQMEGSNVSTNIVQKTDDIVTPTTAFSVSDIDAIVLPATTVQRDNNGNGNANADYLEMKKQSIHKFSLFKDDSSVQLVTSSLLTDHNNENSKQPDFTQSLKADDLLPIQNVKATTTATTTVTTAQQTSSNTDNEVPTLSTSFIGSNADSTTTLLGNTGANSADNDEVTDMMLSDVDATMPTIPKEIDYEKEEFVKKAEHPRSVIDGMETEGQELNFMTTTEAIGTTNFQLDETTIVEVHDAPTIALKELLELTSSPSHPPDSPSILEKSKVEPVELPPIVDMATDTTLMPTVIITTETTAASSAQPTTILVTPTATPSLEAAKTSTSIKTTDRFDNYQQQISTKTGEQQHNNKNDNDIVDDKLNFSNTETTTIATTRTTKTATTATLTPTSTPSPTLTTTKMTAKTSEIDSEQELRMINELVKGNKNKNINEKNINQQHLHQLKAETIKSSTLEAESGPTTTTISALTSDTNLNEAEESSIISAETTLSTQSSSTTEEPSTSTIWSKLMPLFGFSSGSSDSSSSISSSSTTELTDETTNSATTPKSISSSFSAAVTKSNLNTNLSNNRSNRNSKIIRINSLSSFGSSTNSKAQIAGSSVGKQTADKLALSSPQSSQIVATTTTTTETPTSTIITTTTENVQISVDSSSDSDSDASGETSTTTNTDISQGEPFWWLPIGWRLDRANEPSLLLRFWSALPGQGD